jgi:hypothetical protein
MKVKDVRDRGLGLLDTAWLLKTSDLTHGEGCSLKWGGEYILGKQQQKCPESLISERWPRRFVWSWQA